jgi:hypothetical protein
MCVVMLVSALVHMLPCDGPGLRLSLGMGMYLGLRLSVCLDLSLSVCVSL